MSLTFLVLSAGRLNYVQRSLRYYFTHCKQDAQLIVAWSGANSLSSADCEVDGKLINTTLLNYPSEMAFHHKLLDAVSRVKTKYVFLIGDDDLAIPSFGLRAVEAMEVENSDFCFGLKLQVPLGHPHAVRPYPSEGFTQELFRDRVLFHQLRVALIHKKMVANWHMYGVHRQTALERSLKKIAEFGGYSAPVEEYFLLTLFEQRPWARLPGICSVHESDQPKMKNAGPEGFPHWIGTNGGEAAKRRYQAVLEENLDPNTITDTSRLRGGEEVSFKTLIGKPESFFRSKFHSLFAITPFQAQMPRRMSPLRKLVVIFHIAAVMLSSPSVFCRWSFWAGRSRQTIIYDFLALGTRSEITKYFSGVEQRQPEISDAISSVGND